jgi:hypothetical protein
MVKGYEKSVKIQQLNEIFIDGLNHDISYCSDTSVKPLLLQINIPAPLRIRVYLFNCGNPPGGRPVNEYKIVLNVDQNYGERGNFDYSDGFIAIVAGYVRLYDVFVFWDASKHNNFAFNKNMQVKVETILNALGNPISIQERTTRNGVEKIIASRRENIAFAIQERFKILYINMVEH